METKNSMVRRLVSCGEYKEALQTCKDWDYKNPDHREILRRGYECLMYPEFYRQIGYDTDKEYTKSIEILQELYS